jgi:hypothetical protein
MSVEYKINKTSVNIYNAKNKHDYSDQTSNVLRDEAFDRMTNN